MPHASLPGAAVLEAVAVDTLMANGATGCVVGTGGAVGSGVGAAVGADAGVGTSVGAVVACMRTPLLVDSVVTKATCAAGVVARDTTVGVVIVVPRSRAV